MGGDLSPDSEIEGAVMAIQERGDFLEITLVGKEDVIKEKLKKFDKSIADKLRIQNATQVVEMTDIPTDSFRNKPDSSMSVALQLQKEKKIDAMVSTANTGANLTFSIFKLGRIKGISRPTIGSNLPSLTGSILILDVGASVDCKPSHLFEYAIMGSEFARLVKGIENPKIGLLSIGEEKGKGNDLSLKTYELLEKTSLNFIGNIEGRDILKGTAYVVVCD